MVIVTYFGAFVPDTVSTRQRASYGPSHGGIGHPEQRDHRIDQPTAVRSSEPISGGLFRLCSTILRLVLYVSYSVLSTFNHNPAMESSLTVSRRRPPSRMRDSHPIEPD